MNRYTFKDIPNNDEGRELIRLMKKYHNKETYSMRVRGQYLKDELKGGDYWNYHSHGQKTKDSKCLRVYLDSKIEKKTELSYYKAEHKAMIAERRESDLINSLVKLINNHGE